MVRSTMKEGGLVNRHEKGHTRVQEVPDEWSMMPFNEISKGY